jgi:hypothetical protein
MSAEIRQLIRQMSVANSLWASLANCMEFTTGTGVATALLTPSIARWGSGTAYSPENYCDLVWGDCEFASLMTRMSFAQIRLSQCLGLGDFIRLRP